MAEIRTRTATPLRQIVFCTTVKTNSMARP
jgi:hypothetical protein